MLQKIYLFFSNKFIALTSFVLAIVLLLVSQLIGINLSEFDFRYFISSFLTFAGAFIILLLIELSVLNVISLTKEIKLKTADFSFKLLSFYSIALILVFIGTIIGELIYQKDANLSIFSSIFLALLSLIAFILFVLMNYMQLKETIKANRSQILAIMFIILVLFLIGLQIVNAITITPYLQD